MSTVTSDPRWRDLYRVGAISCFAFVAAIIFAVVAYFVWSYAPGSASVATIYANLQSDRIAGLLSIELSVPVLIPITILIDLALYVALKPVNESYALIALVFGLMGAGLWLTARPVAEMAYLSDRYAMATTESAKIQYLAAGEALRALFDGTAWIASQFMIGISGFVDASLMVQGKAFSRVTGYLGIVLSLSGLCFWIPGIGAIVSLLGTIGGVVWYILIARDLTRLARIPAPEATLRRVI